MLPAVGEGTRLEIRLLSVRCSYVAVSDDSNGAVSERQKPVAESNPRSVMANFFPSRDQPYPTTAAGSELKWVNCTAGPPFNGCMYTFWVFPVVLPTYVKARPSGAHPSVFQPSSVSQPSSFVAAATGNSRTSVPLSSFCTTHLRFLLPPCPSPLIKTTNLPSGDTAGASTSPRANSTGAPPSINTFNMWLTLSVASNPWYTTHLPSGVQDESWSALPKVSRFISPVTTFRRQTLAL